MHAAFPTRTRRGGPPQRSLQQEHASPPARGRAAAARRLPLYATAKAAIIGLTRSLAREFGVKKIRVNALLPGWVMTDKQIEQWVTPEAEAEAMEDQCLKERLYEGDMSRLALFLAADDSRMITKQVFIADAGRV